MARFSNNHNRRIQKIGWSESKNSQDQMVRIGDTTRSDGQNRRFQKIRWSESHPSENRQDRMGRIVSANQIIWTVIEQLYHGHILRRIDKIGWSDPEAKVVYAQKTYLIIRNKVATRKSRTITSAISRFTRK